MRRKACKHCGKEFETDKQGAYLCPDCALKSRRDSVLRSRICTVCGASFIGFPKSKRCPNCQAEETRKRRAIYRRNGASRPLGSTDTCLCCGAEYIVEGGTQKYCKECAQSAMLNNTRKRKREYNRANAAIFASAKAENRKYNKICLVCGKVFDANTATVTCSEDCAKALKSLRQAEADYRRGKRKLPPGQKYQSGLPKSGVVGVTARRNGKWEAKYKGNYIGIFSTVPEAAKAIQAYKDGLHDDK